MGVTLIRFRNKRTRYFVRIRWNGYKEVRLGGRLMERPRRVCFTYMLYEVKGKGVHRLTVRRYMSW